MRWLKCKPNGKSFAITDINLRDANGKYLDIVVGARDVEKNVDVLIPDTPFWHKTVVNRGYLIVQEVVSDEKDETIPKVNPIPEKEKEMPLVHRQHQRSKSKKSETKASE